MTEHEWLAAMDPKPMLSFLRGKSSDRTLRLFAVACCRRVWHLMSEPLVRRAVEVAEQFADGKASDEDRIIAHRDSATEESGWHYGGGGVQLYTAAVAAAATANERHETYWTEEEDDWFVLTASATSSGAAGQAWVHYAEMSTFGCDKEELVSYRQFIKAGRCYAEAITPVPDVNDRNEGYLAVCRSECHWQSVVLRDIFGNPFYPVAIDPSWLTPTVVAIAEGIYQDRAFDRMPILADALQDAGCENAEILDHCRQPSEHVRGCWVIDALLGKA